MVITRMASQVRSAGRGNLGLMPRETGLSESEHDYLQWIPGRKGSVSGPHLTSDYISYVKSSHSLQIPMRKVPALAPFTCLAGNSSRAESVLTRCRVSRLPCQALS